MGEERAMKIYDDYQNGLQIHTQRTMAAFSNRALDY